MGPYLIKDGCNWPNFDLQSDIGDKAFNTYFNNSNYISMITKTFGKETAAHISKMVKIKLKRKHNFEKVNY